MNTSNLGNWPIRPTKISPMMEGFVYFMFDGWDYKIGFSNSPEVRIKELRNGRPNLRLIEKFHGTTDDEHALQTRFSHLRLKGEWFKASPEIVELIELVRFVRRFDALRA